MKKSELVIQTVNSVLQKYNISDTDFDIINKGLISDSVIDMLGWSVNDVYKIDGQYYMYITGCFAWTDDITKTWEHCNLSVELILKFLKCRTPVKFYIKHEWLSEPTQDGYLHFDHTSNSYYLSKLSNDTPTFTHSQYQELDHKMDLSQFVLVEVIE